MSQKGEGRGSALAQLSAGVLHEMGPGPPNTGPMGFQKAAAPWERLSQVRGIQKTGAFRVQSQLLVGGVVPCPAPAPLQGRSGGKV